MFGCVFLFFAAETGSVVVVLDPHSGSPSEFSGRYRAAQRLIKSEEIKFEINCIFF